jgi:hypothetical protein
MNERYAGMLEFMVITSVVMALGGWLAYRLM